MNYQNVQQLTLDKYKKSIDKHFSYGTAGFRTKADDLETVLFRMGLLAVLRSKATKAHIGLMITASHNPACDNGVKLVDPLGEMMAQDWESHATTVANAADDALVDTLQQLVNQTSLDAAQAAAVVVGRDTRPSSDRLHAAAVAGVTALGGKVVECGVVTTPLLHYRVVCANDGGCYGEPSNEGYSNKLVQAFLKLQSGPTPADSRYSSALLFDGANGVGGLQMARMAAALAPALQLSLNNDGSSGGELNKLCGADHVKVSQSWPNGVPSSPGSRCVSVDGDADRVIYSFLNDEGAFTLLDGDKIATLIAGYLQQLLLQAGLSLKLGLIQTAYANGASTQYINGTLGVPVACAKTGVKHLHHLALQYDIGVYFEANGHGTVLFSEQAKKVIRDAAKGNANAERLSAVIDVINETVGDAISDMLLVEVILKERGWSVLDWDKQYTDLPNRLVKVLVADRTVISTTDAERRCVSPASLQPALDDLLKTKFQGAQARSFVRPSGTEDVVRVYAEAKTRELADDLAKKVSQLVFDLAGGAGDPP